MIELEELMPNDGQKSFGEKAQIVKTEYVDALCIYSTPVACIIKNGLKFIRLWDGYNSTTMRHINSFRSIYGLGAISKKQWQKMPMEEMTVEEIL